MTLNESETRADLIDPLLQQAGWGVDPETKVLREFHVTKGQIKSGKEHGPRMIADYILVYRNRKVAVIEAKSIAKEVGEGVAQAKLYARKLDLPMAFASNGQAIYSINMNTGHEKIVTTFPTPQHIDHLISGAHQEWQKKFDQVPFETIGDSKILRFYQEIAVNRTLAAIAKGDKRILLTLATGTGKTFIAFQLVWKLFHARWNTKLDDTRLPRILFLADRNILANQALNNFSAFPEDALRRIDPGEIRKQQKVPTNASIFFTIFQTFMSGPDETPYFGEYPADFFDLIIVDECHRGGANDEGNWRQILEHFDQAVQIGMTATPKRKDNVDTYRYFGNPIYSYSLKEGIQDGFLTPFRVRRFQTTLDEYVFTPDDNVVEGDVQEGKVYEEADFNRIIEIKQREAKRVMLFMSEIDRNQKTLVFCATQNHAAAVRDLINQQKFAVDGKSDLHYCVRVTANDGAIGEQFLREFQDNERTVPTILTTSQKLSTGVDALNVRAIVLLRPVKSMIEFKQIVGRGTRLYEGKEFFTIYDFVGAYKMFADPDWDGDPSQEVDDSDKSKNNSYHTAMAESAGLTLRDGADELYQTRMAKITLADGKERLIQHIATTLFYSPSGTPIAAQEFIDKLFGQLPHFFSDETELQRLWSDPVSRETFLDRLSHAGFGTTELEAIQQLVQAEKGDLIDVLEYIAYAKPIITREERATTAQKSVTHLNDKQREFVDFVLEQYIEHGVSELSLEKLPDLLELKYQSLSEAEEQLGTMAAIRVLRR